MTVIEHQSDGIGADRFDRGDADVLFAEHQGFLTGTVPLHLGGRRMHAQVFEGQVEGLPVVEGDVQLPGAPAENDLQGYGACRVHAEGDSGRLAPRFQGFRRALHGQG